MVSGSLSSSYRFRKLTSKVYGICFFIKPVSDNNIRDQVIFHMIKSLFFYTQDYKNKFINYSQTKSEVSMFLDKGSLDRFLHGLSTEAKELMNTDDECYKVFEIFTDFNDLHTPGVTSSISSKFAEKNIPIIYSNSFNSSFILISEKHYIKAISILKSLAKCDEEEVDDD